MRYHFYKIVFSVLLFSMFSRLSAQVTIGSDKEPNVGALLDLKEKEGVESSQRGVILPRVTLQVINSLQPCAPDNPANHSSHKGLLVYNLKNTNGFREGLYIWDGTKWNAMQDVWLKSGNAGTNEASDFLGTTDDRGVSIKTNDIVRMKISNNGNVGIGTTDPQATLDINGSSANPPLRIQNIAEGDISTENIIGVNSSGTVRDLGTGLELLSTLSIPAPAIFKLSDDIPDFLKDKTMGEKQTVPMSVVKIGIKDMVYNESTSRITFPPGTYQIMFVYEGEHTIECDLSSYFVDFPVSSGSARVHSTCSHNGGVLSNHGGTISYSTELVRTRTWQIALGRGQSGNCGGAGMTLIKNSTHLLIYRIGD